MNYHRRRVPRRGMLWAAGTTTATWTWATAAPLPWWHTPAVAAVCGLLLAAALTHPSKEDHDGHAT